MPDPKESRGYRNKNPGNIDHVPTNKWQGLDDPPIETAPPGGRARFCRFVSHEMGIRALAVLLITYQDRHGLRTVKGIVNRWAPPAENQTSSYVQAALRHFPGVGEDDEIDLHDPATLRKMVIAIITHELGGNPYPDSVIDAGLLMAGAPRPVDSVREAARTGTGRAVITGATVTAVTGAVMEAAPALGVVKDLPTWLAIIVIVTVAAAIVLLVLQRRKKEG